MRRLCALCAAGLLAIAGCGGDDEGPAAGAERGTDAAATTATTGAAGAYEDPRGAAADADADTEPRDRGKTTTVVAAASQFGEMLFDSRKQAIYIFENDSRGTSRCYGDCAAAWPPVLTDRPPRAGKGVKASLLSTVRRRDGKLQVSYAGKPLYYYAHEDPGEVRCHDVDLNGGFWWVLGPDGERRP